MAKHRNNKMTKGKTTTAKKGDKNDTDKNKPQDPSPQPSPADEVKVKVETPANEAVDDQPAIAAANSELVAVTATISKQVVTLAQKMADENTRALKDTTRTLRAKILELEDDLDTSKKEITNLKAKIKTAVNTAVDMTFETVLKSLEEPETKRLKSSGNKD